MKTLPFIFVLLLWNTALKAQDFTDKSIWRFNILFETGKSNVQNTYFMKLDSLSNGMKQDTMLQVTITAHTDNSGSDASNEKLSQNRADAVKNYLFQRGIGEKRLKIAWKGEIDPISDNFTEGGKSQNRRVVVAVFRRIFISKVTSLVKNDSGVVVPNVIVTMRSKYLADTTRTDSAGVFTINVPYKQPAIIEVTAKDHFYDKKILNLGVFKANIKEFMIATIEIGKKLRIKDLNFYGDSPILLPEAILDLKILLLFMRINPTYVIELGGHVNQPGLVATVNSHEYTLSVERANTVGVFLLDNGISAERLTCKGYANWFMLFPMAQFEEQMAANRRVEVRVLKK
jgi:outer membrane protein OmpA-like peptidoglycan-associated protein